MWRIFRFCFSLLKLRAILIESKEWANPILTWWICKNPSQKVVIQEVFVVYMSFKFVKEKLRKRHRGNNNSSTQRSFREKKNTYVKWNAEKKCVSHLWTDASFPFFTATFTYKRRTAACWVKNDKIIVENLNLLWCFFFLHITPPSKNQMKKFFFRLVYKILLICVPYLCTFDTTPRGNGSFWLKDRYGFRTLRTMQTKKLNAHIYLVWGIFIQ